MRRYSTRSSLRSTQDAYVKGLDNSTPESYSKLRRFLLRGPGRAIARPFSIPATRRSLATLFSFAPSSHPHLLPSMLRTRPRTSKRQFDKMQISFVSLTTIGFSASLSSPSLFLLFLFLFSLFNLFPQPFLTSSSSFEQYSTPSRYQQSPLFPAPLHFQSFPFSLLATSFFCVFLFNRRSLVCPNQILRIISAGVYH